ncbi:addiction module protein [Variovorax sp. Varisp41]|jgi:putative addiction module component (TIGR02574 family)|uniref:addiction module protein n=1 Tax=unclassified Variovorax TaxID=663243 RepID=UPI000A89D5DB|nr:addiction module protein [Variovorax sp.]MBS77423.1 addiction module protein [Variovorax sp.]
MNALLENIAALGVHEKLQLVEDLWDSIDQELLPASSAELKAELDRRAAWADAHPGSSRSLTEIAASLGVRL